ncbi:uncharacterized protein LOC111280332 isoform X3 [Durio zibethinus]|uniref:Uncharacterized protein LOC111280332 isoform X3 n=1 Tax=Durio zibethinus TaxID=66656 RepID=A0A6P5X6P9_DURZI|nr:uncharacterized protein LOC111280332 isoform X3 [Durio zibethinus]
MAELEKQERVVVNRNKDKEKEEEEEEEEERLLEGMAVLDFDMLCSTVALQTHGKWRKLENAEDCLEQGNGDFGGVFRMWEGEVVLDFLDDRRVALQSTCCPCYRFGKNMRRAGFGYCFLQGNDSLLDDCIYHLICPCCTLSQESRTLEMNNVQDGTWHGRGDICIGSYGEGRKAFFELHPPSPISIKTPEPCNMQNSLNGDDNA